MKFNCNTKTLLALCDAVASAAGEGKVKPVLACIRIEATADSVRLAATDLEMEMHGELRGVDVREAGAILINAAKLTALLRNCKSETVTIADDGKQATISTDTGKFKVATMDAAELPLNDTNSSEGGHTLPVEVLRRMIQTTSFAADRKESGARWTVTGMLIELTDNAVRVVATDTKRAAMHTATAVGTGTANAVVSMKTLKAVVRWHLDRRIRSRPRTGRHDLPLASGEESVLQASACEALAGRSSAR